MAEAVAMNESQVRDACALAAGEGEVVWFLDNLTVVKATAESTGGAYGLIESLVPPGASPPLHVHSREDEAFWILDGHFTVRCGERTISAPAGTFVFLPRGVPHTFVCDSDMPGRVLTLVSPGGCERFFVAAGRPAQAMTLPPVSPPDIAQLRRIAGEFGVEFVGPPLNRSHP